MKLNIQQRKVVIDGLEQDEQGNLILVVPATKTIAGEPAPTLHIVVKPVPFPEDWRDSHAFMMEHAQNVVDAMSATMPQGLLSYVLGVLTLREADCFHVRRRYWERLVEDQEELCPICRSRPVDRSARQDSGGRHWCKECIVNFDSIDWDIWKEPAQPTEETACVCPTLIDDVINPVCPVHGSNKTPVTTPMPVHYRVVDQWGGGATVGLFSEHHLAQRFADQYDGFEPEKCCPDSNKPLEPVRKCICFRGEGGEPDIACPVHGRGAT